MPVSVTFLLASTSNSPPKLPVPSSNVVVSASSAGHSPSAAAAAAYECRRGPVGAGERVVGARVGRGAEEGTGDDPAAAARSAEAANSWGAEGTGASHAAPRRGRTR